MYNVPPSYVYNMLYRCSQMKSAIVLKERQHGVYTVVSRFALIGARQDETFLYRKKGKKRKKEERKGKKHTCSLKIVIYIDRTLGLENIVDF